MKYVSYENSVKIEGNIFRDPSFFFDADEGKDACELVIASCFYPNDEEKEVSYFIVRLYDKELIQLIADLDLSIKGKRIFVTGRLCQMRDAYNSRVIIVASRLDLGPDSNKNKREEGVMEETNKRVRMNVSTTAKGLAQWEVTCEFESVEEAKANLSAAIDAVRNVIKDKGLTEANG
jgi:single-stranded DNA-binding protein